jgi:HAD superfamily hydrolase (TIGR01509 family)
VPWAPRGFAFDLDETLVDCERQHATATRAMLDALGFRPEQVRDVFHETTGMRTRDIVGAYKATLGATQDVDEMLALRHTAFLAALDADPPAALPGARAAVEACRAAGPVACVTSGHRDDAIESLRAIGLLPLFATIVTGEDVLEAKPSPEPYKVACARLGMIADDVLAFEDSPRGVAAARAAGCRVVAVPNARSTPREAVAAADLVLGSLDEAVPLDALLARLRG